MNVSSAWSEASQWLRYAREDLKTAESLLHDEATPRHICFLAQQSAEKTIKSVFVFLQIDFPRTHDLDALRNLLPPEWSSRLQSIDLAELSEWAVESRYPGNWPEATSTDAERAYGQAKTVYDIIAEAFLGMGYAVPYTLSVYMLIPIVDIESFVEPDYAGKDAMHGMAHIRRVLRLAQELAEGREHDPDVLALGAHFHGSIYTREPEIRRFLTSKQMPQETADMIVQVAWESQKEGEPQTVEGTILHDAHLLEGGKTFIITKSLVTGTARGHTLEEAICYIETNILGKFRCYLPEAQMLYAEKERFAREFLADLKSCL